MARERFLLGVVGPGPEARHLRQHRADLLLRERGALSGFHHRREQRQGRAGALSAGGFDLAELAPAAGLELAAALEGELRDRPDALAPGEQRGDRHLLRGVRVHPRLADGGPEPLRVVSQLHLAQEPEPVQARLRVLLRVHEHAAAALQVDDLDDARRLDLAGARVDDLVVVHQAAVQGAELVLAGPLGYVDTALDADLGVGVLALGVLPARLHERHVFERGLLDALT